MTENMEKATKKTASILAVSAYYLLPSNFWFFLALLQSGHLTGSFSNPFSL
jgi:hypothetical protein